MVREIPLTQGKVAIVDDKWFPMLSTVNWNYVKGGYAVRSTGKKDGGKYSQELMHNVILDLQPGNLPDHKNRNGLDNREDNLRLATYSQNNANRMFNVGVSKYKGVYWDKEKKRWKHVLNPTCQKQVCHYILILLMLVIYLS